jgi:hypothetical protein
MLLLLTYQSTSQQVQVKLVVISGNYVGRAINIHL